MVVREQSTEAGIFETGRNRIIEKFNNNELNNLRILANIIRVITSRKMRCVGHVARMGAMRNAYRIFVRKLAADPSGSNAGEVSWYLVQVYFILTGIICTETMRMCGAASEKMELLLVAAVRTPDLVSFVMLNG